MTRNEQIADTAAAVSVMAFLGITIGEWTEIIHLIGGLVAIIAGVAATIFHVVKIRELKKGGK